MRITFLSTFFLAILISAHLQAQVTVPINLHEETDCTSLSTKIKNYDKDKTLVLFDVDNTLISTNQNKFGSDNWFDLIVHAARNKSGYEKCHAVLKEEYTKNTGEAFDANTFRHSFINIINPYVIYNVDQKTIKEVCPDFKTVLNEYKNAVGLTSRGISLFVPTTKAIEKLGFKFTTNPIKRDIWSVIIGGDKNIYYNSGIIYTEGGNKGDALVGFLKWAKLQHIETLIYAEDSYDKLKLVNEALSSKEGQNVLNAMGIKRVELVNVDGLEKTKKTNTYSDTQNFETAVQYIKKTCELLKQDKALINQ